MKSLLAWYIHASPIYYIPIRRLQSLKKQMQVFLNKLNQDYNDYHTNKMFIDVILENIYLTHERSLHIGKMGAVVIYYWHNDSE